MTPTTEPDLDVLLAHLERQEADAQASEAHFQGACDREALPSVAIAWSTVAVQARMRAELCTDMIKALRQVIDTRTVASLAVVTGPTRRFLETERPSVTRKLVLQDAGVEHKLFITVGMYPDGTPGEVFITVDKAGTMICGLMDSLAVLTSLALQHGIPLEKLVEKFARVSFEPAGPVADCPEVGHARSIVDMVFRWLGARFPHDHLSPDGQKAPELTTSAKLEPG